MEKGNTTIVRTYVGIGQTELDEFEIDVQFLIEELYHGFGHSDDPDHCIINEHVKVLEDVGPFRRGDMLLLEENERRELEDEQLYHDKCL